MQNLSRIVTKRTKVPNFVYSLLGIQVLKVAKELEDFELLSRISGGDLAAIEAQYHIGCLTKFRNSHCSLKRKEFVPVSKGS